MGVAMIQFQNDKLTVFQSCLYKTTSTVLNLEEGVIIVDPNWLPNEIEEIATYVSTIVGNKKLYIIYTHSDFDHIIASGAFTNAMVIASEAFEQNPNKEQSIEDIKKFDNAYYISRGYRPVYPEVHIVIKEDGQQVKIGNTLLTFYLAPGHTNDGLFTLVNTEGIFISGDYLSDVEFPFIEGSYADYVKTIYKVQQLLNNNEIKLLIPGHGSVATSSEEVQIRLDQSLYYLEQVKDSPEKLENFLTKTYSFYSGMKEMHEKNHQRANEKL